MSTDDGGTPRLLACVGADVPHTFDDDVDARCALCNAAIYHRPHALEDQPGALPVCLPCALSSAEQYKAHGVAVSIEITERSLREVASVLRDRRGKGKGKRGRA